MPSAMDVASAVSCSEETMAVCRQSYKDFCGVDEVVVTAAAVVVAVFGVAVVVAVEFGDMARSKCSSYDT
jgi:hypothetical protein